MSNNVKIPVIAIGVSILLAVVMRFGIGFDGLYGQDGYEYLRYANALKKFMTDGIDPGDYFWPIWYPLTGALLSFIVQDVAFSLQLVSCISLAIVFIFSNKIIGLIFPKSRSPRVFVFLLIVLSPFILRFSFLVMADMLTLGLLTISTYYLLRASMNGSWIALMLGGFTACTACMTRYAAIVIIFPMALYSAWMFFSKNKNWFNIIPAFIISVLPLVPHFLVRGSQSAGFIQHDWVSHWSLVNFFKNDFITRDGIAHNQFPNIIYAFGGLFHPRYCFPALFILVFGWKKMNWSKPFILLLTGLVLYLFFIAGIPYQNNRFLLLVLPFFVIFLYPPWHAILNQYKNPVRISITSILLIAQLVLFPLTFKIVYKRNQLEKQVYSFVTGKKSPTLYAMDLDISITSRGYPSRVYNLYANYYHTPDTTALVIFNTYIFSQQWGGMNPMNNWTHFNHDYHIQEIKRFEDGWAIYQFE
jgi:hypothetical protein